MGTLGKKDLTDFISQYCIFRLLPIMKQLIYIYTEFFVTESKRRKWTQNWLIKEDKHLKQSHSLVFVSVVLFSHL